MTLYPVLKAVMLKKRVSMQDIADACDITLQSAYNKASGKSGWTLEECRAIKLRLQFTDSIDILFFKPKNLKKLSK